VWTENPTAGPSGEAAAGFYRDLPAGNKFH